MSYSGPPPTSPPPPGQQPRVVVPPAPPRVLPEQDHPALDAAERAARRVTLWVAAAAGAIGLLVLGVLGLRMLP